MRYVSANPNGFLRFPTVVALYGVVALAFACGGSGGDADPDAQVSSDGSADAAVTDGGAPDGTAPDAGPTCPPGFICVSTFPYHDDNDTSTSTSRQYDGYSCMPSVDESGPEIIYQLELSEAGFLSAAVPDDVPGVDVDLQLLSGPDPSLCIDRGNYGVGAHLQAGTYFLVADTWVDAGQEELAGPYALDIGFVVPPVGDCTMTTDVVERLWGPSVTLPATGAMVLEAHLVTQDDAFATANQWPTSLWEAIPAHYHLSQTTTGFVMGRNQPWCPEESSLFGQGATGQYVPTPGEAWYLNMLWSSRPSAGTRMIVQLPGGGPAIVAAAGYETGPGNTDHLGGVTEEIHFYLGTGHLDDMTIGFAADQSLPLGPIRCAP
jgi:hypothetical protein